MKIANPESGFNLIESAIVLSIVSALIGVVMVGRELASDSKVVVVISELSALVHAKDQFKQMYGSLPGDIADRVVRYNFSSGSNFRPSCATPEYLGNGRLDEHLEVDDYTDFDNVIPYEADFAFNQLSLAGLIPQKIDFDPCADPNGERRPGTHRPASGADDTLGYTFIGKIFVYNDATKTFLEAVRLGRVSTDLEGDKFLRGGAFTAKIHREIDAKIDQDNTPTSGKYIVNSSNAVETGGNEPFQCFDRDGYLDDDSEVLCPGNLVEVDPNTP